MEKLFDALEGRTMPYRERMLFRDLRSCLSQARGKALGLRKALRGMPMASLKNREALARIPVLRKAELPELQAQNPPFAGLMTTMPGAMLRLMVSPGPILEPQGRGVDWFGAARALFAAGFRKGDIVHNAFSYHLTPGGHIMESGAHALKCAVIPAGTGNSEQQLAAIAGYRPNAFCGTPDFLKYLLDEAERTGQPAGSIKKAVVSGAAFPRSLQTEIAARGIDAYQVYATADLGVIAYETSARSGLICNENIIVEIVRPGTGDPVPSGEVGEIVVTRLVADYPLLRFGTGDLSKFLDGPSACGRTNLRLAGWLGRADQTTKIKGLFVHPSQVAEIGRRHPELVRLRLVVERSKEQDVMSLKAESEIDSADLAAKVALSLQNVTKMRGNVDIVAVGSLPNDGKVIHDVRPI